MKGIAVLVLLAGCASFDGARLVPGQSTAGDVEALMGRAADQRPGAGGETVYYYPRLHFSTDGAVRETKLIDDPSWNQPDSLRRR